MKNNEQLIKLIKNNVDVQENYEQLFKQNTGFIYRVIKNRAHGIHELEDLWQSSFIALMKAVRHYDETLEETNFLTILKFYILNEIRDLKMDSLPAHTVAKIIKFKRTYNELYNEFGEAPKAYQIMQKMNISLMELEEIQAAALKPISIDAPIGDDEESANNLDLIPYETDFDGNLENEELKQILSKALEEYISDNSRVAITKRFLEGKKLEDIGSELNVSSSGVAQLINNGFKELRHNKKFLESVIDYSEVNEYHHVGVSRYQNTRVSSTENVVFQREHVRGRFNRFI